MSIAVTKGHLSLLSLGALFLAIRLMASLPIQPIRIIPVPKESAKKNDGAILRETTAGIFLAFSILKPTLTVPAMAGILLWAIFERKSYIFVGFAACIGILSLASWFAVGNWIPEYMQLLGITGGAPMLWSLALLAWPWNACYAGLFIGIGIYAVILFIRTRNRAQWFSAAILVGLALSPMRLIYDLLLGILVPQEAKKWANCRP
jgi:hypothetical protein